MAIKSRDLNIELQKIDEIAKIKDNDSQEAKLLKANLKATGLLVKLFRDIRNNQVLIERAKGTDVTKLYSRSDAEDFNKDGSN